MSEQSMDTWRNRLAGRICAWILTYIASEDYSDYIAGAIRYGQASAAYDYDRQRRTTPKDAA